MTLSIERDLVNGEVVSLVRLEQFSADGKTMTNTSSRRDLTDDQWDHGSSAGDIFAVIKHGPPPAMMAGFDGRIPDEDIWNIVNYLRTLRPRE